MPSLYLESIVIQKNSFLNYHFLNSCPYFKSNQIIINSIVFILEKQFFFHFKYILTLAIVQLQGLYVYCFLIITSTTKIMKNSIVFILTIALFVACNQNLDTQNAPEQETIEVEQPIEKKIKRNFSDIGFELMETENLGDLKIGLTVETIEKITGKPTKIDEFQLWEADGFQHQGRTYQKGTIELDFIKLENGNIVSNTITIKKGCNYKTSRNIGIGSTYNEVLTAYEGEIDIHEGKKTLIAGSIYGGIIFDFKNEKVETIFIGSAAE